MTGAVMVWLMAAGAMVDGAKAVYRWACATVEEDRVVIVYHRRGS